MFYPQDTIQKRIFIVGCSRSGTTVVQKHLAAHPQIHTYPETQFFRRLFKSRAKLPLYARLGFTKNKEYEKVETLLKAIGKSDLLSQYPRRLFRLKSTVQNFVGLMDQITLDAGRNIWIEKSPVHFRYTRFFLDSIPNTHVIHVVREGRDVVASLYDRAKKFPEAFPRDTDLSRIVGLWNEAIQYAAEHLDHPHFTVVLYDQFVVETDRCLKRIFNAMRLNFHPATLTPNDTYFIGEGEAWKKNVQSTTTRAASKFDRVFDEKTRSHIAASLNSKTYTLVRDASRM